MLPFVNFASLLLVGEALQSLEVSWAGNFEKSFYPASKLRAASTKKYLALHH